MSCPVPRLHVITDEVIQQCRTHQNIAQCAVNGGADAVQYREKRDLSQDLLFAVASDLKEICQKAHVSLVVNDRVELAAHVNSDGVHLGRRDMSPAAARNLLRDEVFIGGTANSYDEAQEIWRTNVDYLGVGPVFGTKSKKNPAPELGITNFRNVCANCPKPVIAIGGIEVSKVEQVMQAGAWGIAVLSSVVLADDLEKQARKFRHILDGCI